MKILVCLKPVPDTSVKPKLSASKKDIEVTSNELVINPFDEYAIEEALRIQERAGGEVVIITVGPPAFEQTLRLAYAMGGNLLIRVWNENWGRLEPLTVAVVLAEVIKEIKPDLIICGKRATDDNAGQVAIALAERLGWPHISGINHLAIIDRTVIEATKETYACKETWRTKLPAVLSVEKGINEPRYPSIKNHLKAKKVPVQKIDAECLSLPEEIYDPAVKFVELKARPSKEIPRVLFEGSVKERLAFILAGGATGRSSECKLVQGDIDLQLDQFFSWASHKQLFGQ